MARVSVGSRCKYLAPPSLVLFASRERQPLAAPGLVGTLVQAPIGVDHSRSTRRAGAAVNAGDDYAAAGKILGVKLAHLAESTYRDVVRSVSHCGRRGLSCRVLWEGMKRMGALQIDERVSIGIYGEGEYIAERWHSKRLSSSSITPPHFPLPLPTFLVPPSRTLSGRGFGSVLTFGAFCAAIADVEEEPALAFPPVSSFVPWTASLHSSFDMGRTGREMSVPFDGPPFFSTSWLV